MFRNEHIRVGEERAGYAGYELPSWLVWSNKTRVTSTGSSEGRSRTERTSRCGPERGPASGARNDLLDTSNRETRIIGGHCRYHAGYELLRWLKWSLRREPRVPFRVWVVVRLSERAGVVPEGGRLRERRMTYHSRRSGRLGKSVGTASNILASRHPDEMKGGPSLQIQCGYKW